MKIILPIKQVPETGNVKMDPETGTMIRDGVESIINPLDLYAIEIGIQMADKTNGDLTAISMGPARAEEALREAVSMGCAEGILISDPAFAGADTWSTSYVLAEAIKKKGKQDVIICGERATDGDTGQVGPGIAAWLDLPIASYVSKIIDCKPKSLIVKRLVEDGYETIKIETPCVLTVVKEIAYPRLPTLRGKKKSRRIEIPVWTVEDLKVDKDKLGLKGSPTRVVKIKKPVITRNGEIRKPKDETELEKDLNGLIDYIKKIDILQE
jgi:electron transfer flavoprotein beta subunit